MIIIIIIILIIIIKVTTLFKEEAQLDYPIFPEVLYQNNSYEQIYTGI